MDATHTRDAGSVPVASQAAMTRPVTVGSATATFAARLATLPVTSSAHGSGPYRPPDRESASKAVEAATIIPSTDSGVSAATPPRLAMLGDQLVHVQVGDCARDHRQQRHTAGGRPSDRPPAHDRPPIANSPVSTHGDLGAIPLGHGISPWPIVLGYAELSPVHG